MNPLTILSDIPRREEGDRWPILVILLGGIFSDPEVRDEAARLTDARSRFVLIGSNHYWPAYVGKYEVEEDIYGNSGTTSDIHDIAKKAKANGWKALAFFDELSWRQHKGIVTNHEDPTLSATVVNLECLPSAAILSPESTFFIRRLPIVTALAEAYLVEPQQPKDWSKVGNHARNRAFQLHLQAGFYLYDPREPIFGDGSQTSAPSPSRDTTPLKQLLGTDATHEQYAPKISFLIQPLIHLEEEEITSVHDQIQAVWKPEQFRMGRWNGSSSASRRDVARILRHFSEDPDRIIFLLSKPIPGKPLDTAVYDRPWFDVESYKYGIFVRQSLEALRTWWQKGPFGPHESLSQFDGKVEFQIDPLLTFPQSLPPWYKTLPLVEISRETDAGYSNPHNLLHHHYLVFYLTKSLSDEDDQAIRNLVDEDDAAGQGFTYIPWDGDADGGLEDMLQIMKMVRTAARTGFTTEQDWALVFVDSEFKNDKQVIICAWNLEEDGYSGIQYGRTAYEVANCLVNVPGNMDMEDFVQDLVFYPDPDYAGVTHKESKDHSDADTSETEY